MREELSEVLLMESSDPRLKGITVTEVEVDRELAFAEVYVCTIEGITRSKEVLNALDHAQGYLRSELAHRMALRNLPRLRFHWDSTFEHADKIDRLIKSIQQSDVSEPNKIKETGKMEHNGSPS